MTNPICHYDRFTKLDDCPFIWKRFDEARYLTAHVEDYPSIYMFNYMKTGFVKQPVDFYPRTLFLAAKDYGTAFHPATSSYSIDCIGYETNDEIIANYLESTIELSVKENTPLFAVAWSTTLTHDDANGIQISDMTYATLLKRLDEKGHLNNIVLIFMGDHGYRFGRWRQTLIGYYEYKLPNMWIRLPPTVRNKFPHWQNNLQRNQRLLASPYTLYWTLNQILDAFTSTKTIQDSLDVFTKKAIPKKYKQTFFDPIPEETTCMDVGVPDQYCPCYSLQKVESNDSTLIQAAIVATQKINSDLKRNSKCSLLKFLKVIAGAVINKTSVSYEILTYIVQFVTEPGGFHLEAEMEFYVGNISFSADPYVLRASKINQEDIKCIHDAELELFCFCVF